MARNYVRPALNVYQIVDDTVTTPGDHLATCVVGANYELYRYGHEELAPVAYSMTEEYYFSGLEQSKPGFDYSLDTAEGNISIYGENMEAQIMGRLGANGCFSGHYTGYADNEINGCYSGVVRVSDDPFVLQTGRTLAFAAGYEGDAHLDPALQGYPVEIGDKVYVASSAASKEVRATITPIETNVHQGYSGFDAFGVTPGVGSYIALSYSGTSSYLGNGWTAQDQRIKVSVVDVTYGDSMKDIRSVRFEVSDLTDSQFIKNAVDVEGRGSSDPAVTYSDGKAYVNLISPYSHSGIEIIKEVNSTPATPAQDALVLVFEHDSGTSNATLVVDPSDPNNNDNFIFDTAPKHFEADSSDVIEAVVTDLIGADEPSSLQAGPAQVLEGYSGYCQIDNSYSAEQEYLRIVGAGVDGDVKSEAASHYNSAYSTVFLVKVADAVYTESASGATTVTPTPYLKSVTFDVIDTTGRIPVKHVTYSSPTEIKSGTPKDIDAASYPGLKLAFKHDPTVQGGKLNTPYILVYNSVGFKDEFAFYYEPKHQSTVKFTGVRCDSPLCTPEEMGRQADLTSVFVVTKPVDAELTNYKLKKDNDNKPYIQLKNNVIDLPGRDDVPFTENKGDVYISYRVMVVPPAEEDIFDVSDIYDIQDNFGSVDPDNDLAYGCYCAMKGAAGKTVYALRTRGASKEDFLQAIRKTEADNTLYNFAPMSSDVLVMDTVFTYNMSQSTPERKHWRENFFGPRAVQDYELASKDAAGHTILASIVKTGGKSYVTLDRRSTKLDFTAINLNGTKVALYPGDEVEVKAELGYGRYVINKVSPYTLELVEGPSTTYGLTAISLWKTDTAKNAAEYVASVADNFSDRRAVVVWSDNATNAYGTVDNKYLAATVAGMSSSFLPQAPMTRAEVPTVTAAPRMYTRYTQRELDEIAKHGVMIITQDTKGGACYIRHQLTTEMDRGLLHQELSITRNLDNFSYAVVDALEVYIGRSNVTDSAIDALYARMLTLLNKFSSNSTDPKIGPSIGKWEGLQVYQDPTFLTRVIIKVKLYLPVPMNNIDVYELAYAYDSVSGYTEIIANEVA